MPRVSVLMPVYKTNEQYLREAIESILKQTFSDFEFLILDDCPEDPREAIVKSYQDKRIHYVKNLQNTGIAKARNKLLDMASGEYVAIFDHDDVSLPTRLEKQVQYLDEHPEVGVVGCKVQNIIHPKNAGVMVEDADIRLALMRNCVIAHSSSMLRKSVLTDHNIRYEAQFSPAEDYALWCRLIPYTQFHNLDEVLFLYRDHEGNTSHLQHSKMQRATMGIWAFVQAANPVLYHEFLLTAKHTHRIRLFGCIPLLSTVRQGNRYKIYLFEKILLISIKMAIRL
jgi:glycosyltransferase involved in cell wall biosynthesis